MRGVFKYAALVALAVVTAFPGPPTVDASINVCDLQVSPRCRSLVEWWDFEEDSDRTRYGYYSDTSLTEYDATDVVRAAGKPNLGSYSASFSGGAGNYLLIRRWGSMPSYFTVEMWVYQTNQSPSYQELLATISAGGYVLLRLYNGRPQIAVIEDETDTQSSYTTTSAISLSTWTYVVFKLSPYGPYGKAQACVSVNGGAFSCGNVTYNVRPQPGADLLIGGRPAGNGIVGRIDGLGIYSRAFSPADVSHGYDSGNGKRPHAQ